MSYSDDYDVHEGVAIIGLAGRFPGARNVDEFWQNLVDGRETVSVFSEGELDPAGGDEMAARRWPNYVPARGILDDVEMFDASFFGITPNEAEAIDPQHRVFLETAWEALESAGHDPRSFGGPIGVFAGMTNNTYYLQNLLGRLDANELVAWMTAMMGNEKDYLATRVAYKLDLRGPALNIQTACSTSLVAVAAAVQSLLNYGCDMALAGGVSITLPQRRGYLHQDGGITSADGHCRTFDERADGTVFSNGVGIVTLKRLGDAIEDGNTIYAVIKGAGTNNDGASKVSFTAPSVDGHAGVIALAQALSGIDPQTISYVEAHGTATQLGDPIEIAGLTQAFRAGGATGEGFCAIGSVKSNVGHLDAAAGVCGLIKTALALHHKVIPPSLHFTAPNPKLDLDGSPFRVVTAPEEWQAPGGAPRRAGVSSFGVGGTNAHAVLEEAPRVAAPAADDAEQLIVLSARSASALDAATARLHEHLVNRPGEPLADVAFTLQTGRRRFAHRRAVVARDVGEAIARLDALDPERTASGSSTADAASVAFLFPGQGAQAVGMARGLYDGDRAFRAEIDECSAILRSRLGFHLRDVLYPPPGSEAAAQQRLAQTAVTQPALFVIEYALAMAWRRLGIEPDGMIGHSVGEYVAACIAGVFTRDDALKLVAERGRLMQELPGGTMLAVRASADAVRDLLAQELEIAAENAPGSTVVSGATAAIERFEARLAEHGLAGRRLATSHAFHSAMMEPMLEAFSAAVAATPRSAPTLPWISGVTGDWIEPQRAQESDYWVAQLRRPVLFGKGVAHLLESTARVALEVGPGRQLTGLTRHAVAGRDPGVVTLTGEQDRSSLLLAAGRLWVAGVALDPEALHGAQAGRRRVPLPTYPFERARHWVDPVAGSLTMSMPLPSGNDNDVHEAAMTSTPRATTTGRRDGIVDRLRGLFSELSGMQPAALEPHATFVELGLDSLFLTQAAQALQKAFEVKISFRELLDELPTIDALAAHLDSLLPAEAVPLSPPAAAPAAGPFAPASPGAGHTGDPADAVQRLIAEQLEIMRRQLEVLGGGAAPVPARPAPAPPPAAAPAAPPAAAAVPAEATPPIGAFGPYRPPAKGATGSLSARQEQALQAFVARYTARTAGSKRLTAQSRSKLADPRTAAGFRLLWKELVYPIVTVRSSGSRLWDVDGNEYVDLTNGFGAIMFGHNPDFISDALRAQLDDGIEIGPQTPLAGEVAARVAAMVGMERVAFCNTGSEAVTAAIRVARTVSGRDKIVTFDGAYHGIFDEVLVRAAGGRSMPIAPGVPLSMVDNVVVLEYASDEALDYLKAHGDEIAAVLVEPVQSRNPELQPSAFLHEVRRLTEASGTALVFDEIVTGFRTHPGGIQAIFGIRADLATYGKVLGGGLPIGVVAGRREYMDALDGGAWEYGDASVPEVGVTFFAGTFVRHPLALAAARAVLDHLEASGPDLQRSLNLRATEFAARLDAHAQSVGAPMQISHFSSWILVTFPPDVPHAGLFFAMMRDRGVHMWEGRGLFLTTAHSDADLDLVFDAFADSIADLQVADLLPGAQPPVPGASRGHDADGREAWFVPDPDRPGKYLQVAEAAAGHG